MKMTPVLNRQVENTSISFGGFKSVVAGTSYRQDNNFIALALRLTGEDLKIFREVLNTFPNKELEEDVLHISVAGYEVDSDSPFGVYINHQDVFESENVQAVFVASLDRIVDLLARISIKKKIDTPIKTSPEEEEMLKALVGNTGYTFNEGEVAQHNSDIKSVAGGTMQ